jgi:16S rRNA (cytosine1402-N4)-methyltransferase
MDTKIENMRENPHFLSNFTPKYAKMNETTTYHTPVLLSESVDLLAIDPDGTYVDLTFGGGGHSRHILSQLSERGRLFSFDQDPDAKANCPDDPRFHFV